MVPLLPHEYEDHYHIKIKELMRVPLEATNENTSENGPVPTLNRPIRYGNAIKVKVFFVNFLLIR